MPLCGIAEYWSERIMSRKSKILISRFGVMPEAFLYSDTSIVKDDLLRSATKVFKSFYYPFKKAFFILPIEGGYKYISAVAFSHTPYLYLLFAALEDNSCFTPVDLYSFGRFV